MKVDLDTMTLDEKKDLLKKLFEEVYPGHEGEDDLDAADFENEQVETAALFTEFQEVSDKISCFLAKGLYC
jgi:hypothetical protein